ncbi:uncharacterized protein LOC142219878 [Haematobia irritans]|uniref:uncharacterized protein LOC142219878 n=1 Tax=Haematobia irritans TaxID=7368 RepID=UPI003F4F9039
MSLSWLFCFMTFITILRGNPLNNTENKNSLEILVRAKGAEMHNYMDESKDPCENFYEFACGNYQRYNPANSYPYQSDIVFTISNAFRRKVFKAFNADSTMLDEAEQKVKQFYDSCLNLRSIKGKYRQKLKEIISEFGKMPALEGDQWNPKTFEWLTTVAKIASKYNIRVILDYDILPDFKDEGITKIQFKIQQGIFQIKSPNLSSEDNEIYRGVHKEAIAENLEKFLGFDQELASQTAREILNFESLLIEKFEEKSLSKRSLQQSMWLPSNLLSTYVDTYKYEQLVFGILPQDIKDKGHKDHIFRISNAIIYANKKEMANYIFYYLLEPFMLDYGAVDPALHCFEETQKHFSNILDAMIYRKYDNSQMEHEIEDIFWTIKTTFRDLLLSRQYNWMGYETRKSFLRKLEKMQLEINSHKNRNFPKELEGLILSNDDYVDNLKEIFMLNARNIKTKLKETLKTKDSYDLSFTPAYIVKDNLIKVPVSFLQPFFIWSKYYPNALTFSSLGFLLSHELLHAFDEEEWLLDENVKSMTVRGIDKWKFNRHLKCFRQQYRGLMKKDQPIDEHESQSENLADNGGIRLAYMAYDKFRKSFNFKDSEMLPRLNYTSDQLFFISYAQHWCNSINSDIKNFYNLNGDHSPSEIRVIGPLSNLWEFATAFNCPLDKPMNPSKKCILYERKTRRYKVIANCSKLKINIIKIFLLLWLWSGLEVEAQKNPFNANANHGYLLNLVRLAKSAGMRSFMNESVNPCENFYEFACGNYNRLYPPNDPDSYVNNRFKTIANALGRKILEVLKEQTSTDTLADMKVKHFYESCMNGAILSINYKDKLKEIVAEFGSMPAVEDGAWNDSQFEWLPTVAKIAGKYGVHLIMGFDIRVDALNKHSNSIRLKIPETSLGHKSLYTDEHNAIYREVRKENIARFLVKFLDLSQAMANRTAKEIFDFETKLAVGYRFQSRTQPSFLNPTTLESIQAKYYPSLDFKEYFNSSLGILPDVTIYDLADADAQKIIDVVNFEHKRIVANYIFYYLLEHFMIDLSSTRHELELLCLAKTKNYFANILDNMVYRKYNSSQQQMQQDVELMWRTIKATFLKSLQSLRLYWMGDMTRLMAISKLKNMRLEINAYEHRDFIQELEDLTLNKQDYVENVWAILMLNAQKNKMKIHQKPDVPDDESHSFSPVYIYPENLIKVPIAILQPYYLWSNLYPNALKYATLGFLISHELIHGFDEEGRYVNANGNYFDWWEESGKMEFKILVDCLRQQYQKFVYNGHHLKSFDSQSQNIADNGGIRLAYEAYQNWYDSMQSQLNMDSEIMPRLNYTSRQLFFIAYGQLWCSSTHPYLQNFLTANDDHTPYRFRVIGPLTNLWEFSFAFQCTSLDKMNPLSKCSVY